MGVTSASIEITEVLKEKPHLTLEAVALVKARIKDRNPSISRTAMDLLDTLMQTNEASFQNAVQRKVLKRISKLAEPNKGIHPLVQRKAESLIKQWSSSQKILSRENGDEFIKVAESLKRKSLMYVSTGTLIKSPSTVRPSTLLSFSVKSRSWSAPKSAGEAPETSSTRRRSCVDLSTLSKQEVVEVAKMSQKAIMQKIQKCNNPDTIETLFGLHKQLSDDLDAFYARQSLRAKSPTPSPCR